MDVELIAEDVAGLTSPDAIAALIQRLGYDTAKRAALTPEAIGLTDGDKVFQRIELLSEDAEGFLRVVFAQVRSITAKARNDLVRALGRFSHDHLIILTSDFHVLEFVLIDKVKRHRIVPGAVSAYKPVPKVYSIIRKAPTGLDLRILRRLTFTQRDALDQFDKLRTVFEAAAYTGRYYQNRALFADHYLDTRLHEDDAWRQSPNDAFAAVKALMADVRQRLAGKDEAAARRELYDPLWKALGFKAAGAKKAAGSAPAADYVLSGSDGKKLTVALVYRWERWLDGSDASDPTTPDENPGAAVVSILERGEADWVIVTNGKHWRLYSRQAHSRSTNFYEVDLEEALDASGETDPNEAFRYWWLFFRPEAFASLPTPTAVEKCWLDVVAAGSREYAKQVEERLKKRVFEHIVPHLAEGFLADRRKRLGLTAIPSEGDLEEVRQGTLTLLYRLLFLLYAESRGLLPVRESPYHAISLRKVKEEVAQAAGPAESDVDQKLAATFNAKNTTLYDRLARVFAAMDAGDSSANVPTYNGGLFLSEPEEGDDSREAAIARFLASNKVPDLHLAQAIDHLSRDPDERRGFEMVFIDYKSLGVRQLGSIYEGLLEFKLKVADEDLTTISEKGREKVIPLSAARGRRRAEVAVRKGEVYLANDKSERRATGSYYTPDHIVSYIVENTVGPVLQQKLDDLRPAMREAQKDYSRHLRNALAGPHLIPGNPRSKADLQAGAKLYAVRKAHEGSGELVERLFDCKVLDPAMGSGHFLVEAVDFITDKLLDFLNHFPNNPVATALALTRDSILESLAEQGVTVDPEKLTDVHLLKRHVLKRCIYGVDLNPMAVELAKVSLWLDAFTLGAPLSFLDHHLRCGNSLIGEMDISQHILPGSRREGEMLRAVSEMLEIARSADARVEDVKTSQRLYEDIERIERRFRKRLNVETASHFIDIKFIGNAGQLAFDESFDPSNPPPHMERSARDFTAAQKIADERRFFHWPLEFPEVFFGIREDSRQHIDFRMPPTGGFDVVIGNPPYDELSEHAAGRELPEMAYFREEALYHDALGGRLNLYRLFIARALSVLSTPGRQSFIVPMSLLADSFTSSLRKQMLNEGVIRLVEAFPQKDDPRDRVFVDAKLSTCIYVAARPGAPDQPILLRTYPGKNFIGSHQTCRISLAELNELDPEMLSLPAVAQPEIERWQRLRNYKRVGRWSEVARCYLGELMTNASNAHLTSPKPVGPRLLRGANINFYVLLDEPKQGEPLYLKESKYHEDYASDVRAKHHLAPRVGFQESCPIDNWRRLIACVIPAGHYCVHKIRYFTPGARYDIHALLAIFNSKMADWRFCMTSTNNSLSGYEIDVLPIPRFARLATNGGRDETVDWARWDGIISSGHDKWEHAVLGEMKSTPDKHDAWPDTIHDALAAAGKEMSRLGQEWQESTRGFAQWLVTELQVDEDSFTGMTHIRGGQADFERLGWPAFADMLRRNRRACGTDPDQVAGRLEKQYAKVSATVAVNRARFASLDAAIDRIVWQLVGLNPDGSLS